MELTESDIPGETLHEPLEDGTMQILRHIAVLIIAPCARLNKQNMSIRSDTRYNTVLF